MASLPYATQNFSTTLNVGGGINNSQTTGIILTSVSGLNTNGGILCLDWASTLDTATAEYIEYTGISGNELTGVTRGVEGTSAKSHSNGATVVVVVSAAHINRGLDRIRGVDTTGISPTQVIDTNGNEVVKFTATGSAVNEVTVTNAATGNAPSVTATGGDTNIDISVTGKGSGKVKLGSGALKFPNTDGTSGQVLKTDGSGVLSFGDVSGTRCFVRRSSDFSVANSTETAIEWNAEDTDPDTMHDTGSNTTRITVPTAGLWLVTALIVFQNSGTGQRQVFTKVNGTTSAGVSYIDATASDQAGVSYSKILSLSANDYIEIWVSQNSGGSLNVLGGTASTKTVSVAQVVKLSS